MCRRCCCCSSRCSSMKILTNCNSFLTYYNNEYNFIGILLLLTLARHGKTPSVCLPSLLVPFFIHKRAHCYLMKHIFVSHALACSQQSSYSISLHIVISPLLLHRYHLFIPYECWSAAAVGLHLSVGSRAHTHANTQHLNFSKIDRSWMRVSGYGYTTLFC